MLSWFQSVSVITIISLNHLLCLTEWVINERLIMAFSSSTKAAWGKKNERNAPACMLTPKTTSNYIFRTKKQIDANWPRCYQKCWNICVSKEISTNKQTRLNQIFYYLFFWKVKVLQLVLQFLVVEKFLFSKILYLSFFMDLKVITYESSSQSEVLWQTRI